jgi:hypothetical protein
LQATTKEIKIFLEKPSPKEMKERGKSKVDEGSTSTCNFVSTQNTNIVIAHWIDMENISFPGKSFCWKKNHPSIQNHVKTVYSVTKEEKEEKEDTNKPDFPPNYQKVIEGECQLDESKAPEWMDAWKSRPKNLTFQ